MRRSCVCAWMLVLCVFSGSALARDWPQAFADILDLLEAQQLAWNGGDLEAWMSGYDTDEDLRSARGNRVTVGWKATLAEYKSSYPDKAMMGEIGFTDVRIEMLGSDHALAFGHWDLRRSIGREQGLFTFVMRRIPGGWRIAREHWSAGPVDETVDEAVDKADASPAK